MRFMSGHDPGLLLLAYGVAYAVEVDAGVVERCGIGVWAALGAGLDEGGVRLEGVKRGDGILQRLATDMRRGSGEDLTL